MKMHSYIFSFTMALLFFAIGNSQSKIVSEDILLMNDSIQLPGTLSYNKDLKKQPLVIFIQGSGNPDRNGNQAIFGANANYIKTLRDSVNINGIAFYSYDKRNVTKSNIPLMLKKGFVFEDLAEDAKKAIDHFAYDKRFSSITLLGHSQGSLVAMLSVSEKVDYYISLAGVGESVDHTIVRQISSQNNTLGEAAKAHFKELKQTGKIAEPNPLLVSIFAKQNLEFLKSYMRYKPEHEITKLKIPILIINGTKDIQVSETDAKKLHDANPSSQLAIIDKMNHVLKIIEKDTDNIASYSNADFPLSRELVTVITDFIKKK